MKLKLEVNNKTTQKISKNFFLSVFYNTLEIANLGCLKDKDFELSIALVDLAEMETLNQTYRKKKGPTDVLSFNEYRTRNELCKEKSVSLFLGEIILCPQYIAKNALEDKETFDWALSYITSHGVLHLLNFRHGQRMFDLQKKVAVTLNNFK